MKKTLFALLATVLLTACGNSYTVATPDDLKDHPELEGVVATWQEMVDAAGNNDCATILTHVRQNLAVTTESCDALVAYLNEAPAVDWARTDWTADKGKAKIYETNGASITGFILDTKKDVWGADSLFWQN